jgi:hypothetical protein
MAPVAPEAETVASVDDKPSADAAPPVARRLLSGFLQAVGTIDLLAAVAVLLPRSVMAEIHAALGLGALPGEPIVGYLARSVSMFYAFCGALLIVLGRDVVRHRSLIRFVGRCGVLAGVLLLGIDLAEGLPGWWTAIEGPCCVLLAGTVLTLQGFDR